MLLVRSLYLQQTFRKLSRFYYEIPERYRNSFFLANAAFFDDINWFIHRAFQLSFNELILQILDDNKKLSETEARNKLESFIKITEQPSSIVDVRFPIKRANGSTEIIRGFRAQHGLFYENYPSLGGMRIQESITRDQIKAMSVLSTYKYACMGIRMAGAHGGIKINPSFYSQQELKTIIEQYSQQIQLRGYRHNDVIEPDLGAGNQEMPWFRASGKPAVSSLTNSLNDVATAGAQAAFFALDYFLNNPKYMNLIGLSSGFQKKTYIICGLGNLGSCLAKYLKNCGAVCVGIKEHNAFIYDRDGIDIQLVIDHMKLYGNIREFPEVKPGASDEILEKECDILIMASYQKHLNCYVAKKLKAKLILEAANGALTPLCHRTLVSLSKLVVPDIYVCSGYCIASFLEYLLSLKQRNLKQFDEYLIRNSVPGIYKSILETVGKRDTIMKQVVVMATKQKIVECEMENDILTYALEHVMNETANEIVSITSDFNLGLDLKSAGYIKAIKSIMELGNGFQVW